MRPLRRTLGKCGCTALILMLFNGCGLTLESAQNPTDEWPVYGHDGGGMRHSPLTEITRANVARLAVAWTFHTGDISDGRDNRHRSGFETTPIVVDATLYLSTATNRIVALDPETG